MISFRRVKKTDVQLICENFKKIFLKKISQKYYINKYFNGKTFTSFVALDNKKIISHVGFSKRYLLDSINKNKYLYSRHTSFTLSKYRKAGIYSTLCNFAFKKLSSQNNLGFIVWPNNKNLKLTENFKKYHFISTYKLFYSKSTNKKNIKNSSKKNLVYSQLKLDKQNLFHNDNYKTLNKQLIKSIFKINIQTLLKEYNIYKNYYFLNKLNLNNNKSFIIYYPKVINNVLFFNLLYYYGKETHYEIHLKNFIQNSSKYNASVTIWCNESKKVSNFIKSNFYFTNQKFNISFIGDNIKVIKMLKKNNFYLGDTDVFTKIY